MAKVDPELAKLKQALAAAEPSMDVLLTRDPVRLTDEELRAGVEGARRERALWQFKQSKAGRNREGGEEGGDGKSD